MEALARHSQTGIYISALPQTIRDAIQVTRHLQVRLLWVDSLCIVQDDADELAREMANMSSYYGNSLVTISASAAKSAAEGFLRPFSDTPYDRQQDSFELPFRFSDTARGYVRLLPPRTACSEAIDSRAWTLQESLTSTRLVSFGRDTISWSCLSEHHGEVKLGRLRQLFRECKARLFRPWIWSDRLPTSSDVRHSAGVAYMDIWNEIVCEYCDRHLSDPADGLAAISGIAYDFSAAVQSTMELFEPQDPGIPEYLAGLCCYPHLPHQLYLPHQLLWQPREPLGNTPRHVYVAPSWSWAAARAPLRRYDKGVYLRWITGMQDPTPFNVESSNLELSNASAPYGALESGYLMVRGRTCTTDASSVHLRKLDDIQIFLDVGGRSADPDFLSWFSQNMGDVPLTLLGVARVPYTAKTGDIFPRGLVLSKNEDGSYRRLGLYTGSTPESWETATLKLV